MLDVELKTWITAAEVATLLAFGDESDSRAASIRNRLSPTGYIRYRL